MPLLLAVRPLQGVVAMSFDTVSYYTQTNEAVHRTATV